MDTLRNILKVSKQLLCVLPFQPKCWSGDFDNKCTLTAEWNHLLQCLGGMKPCRLSATHSSRLFIPAERSLELMSPSGWLRHLDSSPLRLKGWYQTLQLEGFLWLPLNINLTGCRLKMKDALDLIRFSRAAGCLLLPADEASVCTSLGGKLFWTWVSDVLTPVCGNLWGCSLKENSNNNLILTSAIISICNNSIAMVRVIATGNTELPLHQSLMGQKAQTQRISFSDGATFPDLNVYSLIIRNWWQHFLQIPDFALFGNV